MVVEYHKREWLLDHVGPYFAHVVVVAVVKKMDSFGVFDAGIVNLLA